MKKPTKKEARQFAARVLGHAMSAAKLAQKSDPELDAALGRISAIKSFAELCRAQREHGYTPTLRTDHLVQRRSAAAKREMADVLRVRAALRAEGLKVWPETVPGE